MKILQVLFLIFGLTVFANAQKADLSGTIYDPTGAVIPKVKVAAFNDKGKKFEAISNDEGVYTLNLDFSLYASEAANDFKIAKYKLIIEKANGFNGFVLENFNFVSPYSGTMKLDIALDPDNSNCGAGGCIPAESNNLIKNSREKVTRNILQKSLEKLPKKPNQSKGKIKNNE